MATPVESYPRTSERTASARRPVRPADDRPPQASQTETSPEPPPQRSRLTAAVVGSCLAAVVLIGYFVWLCVQMGRHAQTGTGSLIAIFGAAALGVAAGGLALWAGRGGR